MSSRKRKDGVITFDDLQREVDRSSGREGETFRFQVDTDTLIEVPAPTLDQTKKANEALGKEDEEGFFRVILGDQFDTIMEAFGPRDVRLFAFFQKRLVEFYNLGEALA